MATLVELTAQIQALDAAADASYAAVQAVRNVTPPNVQSDLGLVTKALSDLEALLKKILEAETAYPASTPTWLPVRDKIKAHYLELKEWQGELTKIVTGQPPSGPAPVVPVPVASSTSTGPVQIFPVPVNGGSFNPNMTVPTTVVVPSAPMDLSPVLVPAAGGLIGYLVRQTPMGAAIGALAGIAYEIFVRKDR